MSAAVAAFTLALGFAGNACTQPSFADIFGPETFHGLVEARAAAADGETSWLKQGFGKTSVSGDGPALAFEHADLEWKPSFGFLVSGDFSVIAQPHVTPGVDVGEAYLKLKAPPTS